MFDWLPEWTTPEWAQVLSAVFAALAALAAWASVRQGQRIWRSSLLPELHAQGLFVRDNPFGPRMAYVVHNAGGGLAKGALFLFAEGNAYVAGAVGDGFIRPDESCRIETDMQRAKDGQVSAVGVVSCRDTNEISWAWDTRGNRRQLQRWKARWRPPKEPLSMREIFERFYPDVDLDALTEVSAASSK